MGEAEGGTMVSSDRPMAEELLAVYIWIHENMRWVFGILILVNH